MEVDVMVAVVGVVSMTSAETVDPVRTPLLVLPNPSLNPKQNLRVTPRAREARGDAGRGARRHRRRTPPPVPVAGGGTHWMPVQ